MEAIPSECTILLGAASVAFYGGFRPPIEIVEYHTSLSSIGCIPRVSVYLQYASTYGQRLTNDNESWGTTRGVRGATTPLTLLLQADTP